MQSIRIEQHGGPDVIQVVDLTVGEPRAGEVRVRNHAIGVNFIDTYHRTGLYKVALPSGLGVEGAGVVEAVGASAAKTPCATSQTTTWSIGWSAHFARFARLPVEKLSRTTTRWPASMNRSTVWDPMKPAPPVTTTIGRAGTRTL